MQSHFWQPFKVLDLYKAHQADLTGDAFFHKTHIGQQEQDDVLAVPYEGTYSHLLQPEVLTCDFQVINI